MIYIKLIPFIFSNPPEETSTGLVREFNLRDSKGSTFDPKLIQSDDNLCTLTNHLRMAPNPVPG